MANAREIGRRMMADLKRDMGLTEAQAAGVVGNLLHESANFGTMQEVSPQAGRGGYGYAQWTGPRRTSFENYVRQNDLEPNSYEANYGFLRHEVQNDPYERRQFNMVRQATTPAQAARIVSEEYLRPDRNLAHNDRRVRLANQALELRSGPAGKPAARSNNALAAIANAAPGKKPSAFGYAPSSFATPQAAPKSSKAAPTPATQSAALSKQRSGSPDARRTPKLVGNSGDSLALAPVRSGPPPMFDGAYNQRLGGMTRMTPAQTAGLNPRSFAPALRQGQSSFAGQDRSIGAASKSAPKPANQSLDMAIRRAPGTTVAAIPTRQRQYLPELPPSTLDQRIASTPLPRSRPNTTQVVATIPTSPKGPSAFGSFQQGGRKPGQTSGNPINVAGYPVGPKTFVAQPAGSINNNKGTARLAAGQNPPGLPPTPAMASAALQARRFAAIPNAGLQVGTQLAVKDPKTAPRPFMRPEFGIGGPDLVGLPQTGAPQVGAKTGTKSFSIGKTPPPNLLQTIGDGFMNNTVAGRLVGAAMPGVNNLANGRPMFAQLGAPPPLNILVDGARTIQPPRQAMQPPQQMVGPSVIQQLRAGGLSAAAAYDRANSGNSPRSAADNFGQGTSNSNNSIATGGEAHDAATYAATLEWLRKRGR